MRPPSNPLSGALICFAVREESKFFKKSPEAQVLITGMGQDNARRKVYEAIAQTRPSLVLTCGFAGALNPALRLNEVLFEAAAETDLGATLKKCGAIPSRFHCASQILVRAAEKQALFDATKADAVEMESLVIREICAKQGIPSATVRVISDIASEDLPLDFNALMSQSYQINFFRLGCELIKSPGKIRELRHFQSQTISAARALGVVLTEVCDILHRGGTD